MIEVYQCIYKIGEQFQYYYMLYNALYAIAYCYYAICTATSNVFSTRCAGWPCIFSRVALNQRAVGDMIVFVCFCVISNRLTLK